MTGEHGLGLDLGLHRRVRRRALGAAALLGDLWRLGRRLLRPLHRLAGPEPDALGPTACRHEARHRRKGQGRDLLAAGLQRGGPRRRGLRARRGLGRPQRDAPLAVARHQAQTWHADQRLDGLGTRLEGPHDLAALDGPHTPVVAAAVIGAARRAGLDERRNPV